MSDNNLFYRAIETSDLKRVCQFPQNSEELFFMFPKAEYPLTVTQLETAINNRFDSTVVLLNKEIAGFANFYEVIENEYCSIGNVVVNQNSRNQGVGKFLIHIMEQIAIKKYNVSELRLSCFNTNTIGILLYSKLGYIPYKIEQRTDKRDKLIILIKMKKEV